jgi:histidinol-phosphate aminotransferase
MSEREVGRTMDYAKVPDPGEGLRLHLNENTGGCSPKVLEALRAITAGQVSFYPDYATATAACAGLLGVDPSWVVLTNGLDEGIWSAASSYLRAGDAVGEAIISEPAFDMYAACVNAVGGRLVAVPPRADLVFPLARVLDAITPRTRLVFLCSPNNPTGLAISNADLEAVAAALPAGALLFIDEAYVDFARGSFLPRLEQFPNVVIGRTFAKAYGLAALRVGCVVGWPETISLVRRTIPPYSLNVCALEGLLAAIADRDYQRWYCGQVAESRELVYESCRRLGLAWWPSEANFVLVRVGPRASELVEALALRRIFIRDRTGEPGCEGCVRITAGVVEHTRACLSAIEEVLCEAQ